MTVTDFPDWQAPSAHAAQIAQQGVPLLTQSNVIGSIATGGVAPGGLASTGALKVTQVGYEVIVSCKFPAGTASPFALITLGWVDSGTSLQVGSDSFIVPGSTSPAGLTVRGRGPTKGDQVRVTVKNLDAAQTATLGVTVLQNSRVYPADVWRFQNSTANGATVPSFTLPTLPDDESCLGTATSGAIAASGSASWLMGIGTGGPVTLGIEASGETAANARFHAYALPSSIYGNTAPLIDYTAGNLNQQYTFNPPRAPWLLQAVNSGTAGTLTVSFAAFAST